MINRIDKKKEGEKEKGSLSNTDSRKFSIESYANRILYSWRRKQDKEE